MRASRALDDRLVRHARATRTFLGISIALGVVAALLIVAQAWLLADIVTGAFVHGRGPQALSGALIALLVVVAARAAVAWAAELAASRSSARAKSQLRASLLGRVASTGAAREQGSGELAILATRGVDALDAYFSLYLPRLVLAVIVPLVILVAVLADDWLSAAIVALTIGLIPLFMALVGATTGERTERELRVLQRLSGHFLDVVAGLPTLKVFGRARAQAKSIAQIAERHRVAAMATLRLTFLSSLVLELVATLSVAVVAVAIGLRLMGGELALQPALFVLVLAPEAYLPLRRLGASYHVSAEGVAAARQIFDVIEAPAPPRGARTPTSSALELDGVTVRYPGRPSAALDDVSLHVEPGENVALAGPSGCGKSTLVHVVLGLVAVTSGSVRLGGVELADVDLDAWRAHLAWVPQRPHLFARSIADNVRLGRRDATDAQVAAAIADAGLTDVVARLPDGLRTLLGDAGAGLSAGERQRVALARAFLRDAPLLVLDEPTANLDGATERAVLDAVTRLARGRTVLLVAHRPALLELADRVVTLDLDRETVAA